jgi:glycosyltransferase involved in cell wall biosynthesis
VTGVAPGRGPTPRVALVGPGPDGSGGIARAMTYVLAELPDSQRVRVLDTRGPAAHPLSSLAPLLRSCVRLLRLAGGRHVDVVHVNISVRGSTLRKTAVVAVCHLVRVPTVLHLHGSGYDEYYAGLAAFPRRIVRWVFRAPAAVIVLGTDWRDFVCGVLGVPVDRVTVLPNAVPGPQHVAIRRRQAGQSLQILFLGRLGERKGVTDLLDALADARLTGGRWRATLAGDGDVEGYRGQAVERGIAGQVVFPGWVSPPTALELLAAAHVLVQPSHAEGLPLAILEAFAHGVPVVGTPVGSIPEVVTHGVDGLLVPPGRPDLLAAALAGLAGDESRRWALAARARRTWECQYAIGPYVDRLSAEWRRIARPENRDVPSTDVPERTAG